MLKLEEDLKLTKDKLREFKKDNKKIIKSQDVESVPAGEAAPGGPGPM